MAKHESRDLKSALYIDHNNAFGMKVPSKRKSLRNGTVTINGETFSTYSNPGKSLADLFLYFDEFRWPSKVLDLREYVNRLYENGYFLDLYTTYRDGLNYFLKNK